MSNEEPVNFEHEKAAVTEFWRNGYVRTFMDKDVEGFADHFALPCLMRAEGLPRTVFTRREELVEYLREVIRIAHEAVWARSGIDRFEVRILDSDVAAVEVDAARFDSADRLTSRLYASYVLNKVDGEWKMVSVFGGFYPD